MKKILLFCAAFIFGSIATLHIRQSFADPPAPITDPHLAIISHLKLPQPQEVVLQTMQQINDPIVLPTPSPGKKSSFANLLKPLPTPKVLGTTDPDPRTTKYPRMSIAIVGDSMVDTMGTNLPYLQIELGKIYPTTTFTLLNYGIGGTNIDAAPGRTTQPYTNQDRHFDSITNLKPDLVIIESFAYNPLPLSDSNLAHHTDILTQIVGTLKDNGINNILLMATIAPNIEQFGKGPGGVNWGTQAQDSHTTAINTYLQNMFLVSKSLNLPLIDAYSKSRDLLGNGLLDYINSHDHIHPSVAGHQFIAKQIADTLVATRILE